MARGTEAKQKVINKIISTFGKDYAGELDKKHYVWATEDGERIQVAITLTCPKNPVLLGDNEQSTDLNFEEDTPVSPTTAEISEQEKQNIADLMARLGL